MGYVREVKVQTGDHVREGQLLVTLDARDLDVNSRRAEAALDEVRTAMPGSRQRRRRGEGESRSRAGHVQPHAGLLRKEVDLEPGVRRGVGQAQGRAGGARDGAGPARATGCAGSPRSSRMSDRREVTRSYAEITAPFAGVVTAKSVDPGTLAVPGAPLLTIEREGAYRLEASVDESHLAAIRVGQPVSVTLDGIDRTLEARVSEIVPAVDAASRSYTVKIDLPALQPALRSGVFGRARFQLGSRLAAHDSGRAR